LNGAIAPTHQSNLHVESKSKLIVICFKIFLHFCKDCGTFCKGERDEPGVNGLVKRSGLIDFIGLDDIVVFVNFIDLFGLIGFIGFVDFIGDVGLNGLDGIVSLSLLFGIIGLYLVDLGLVGYNGLGINGISLVDLGFFGVYGLTSFVDLGFFGVDDLSVVVGLISPSSAPAS